MEPGHLLRFTVAGLLLRHSPGVDLRCIATPTPRAGLRLPLQRRKRGNASTDVAVAAINSGACHARPDWAGALQSLLFRRFRENLPSPTGCCGWIERAACAMFVSVGLRLALADNR